jgi:crotonobetaine/carnitine-CoA ligase
VRTVASGRSLTALLREPPDLVFDGPDGVARYSGAEVRHGAEAAAGALAAAGVGPGDRVHLHLHNSPDFLFAWFACAGLGAVMVPTNPSSTADELRYVLEHSGARITVAQPETADVARAAGATLLGGLDGAPRPLDSHAGDLALLYTSGTTARPKAVRVTHAAYVYAGEVVAGHLRLTDADRVFTALPLFHGNAQYYTTMSALTAGATMILAERFSASGWLAQAARHEATVGSLFAAPIRMILAREPAPVAHRLRVVLFAQNLTERQLADWDERIGAPLLQLYGMTETVGPPLMNPLRGERRAASLGRPTLGYACRVGADGELLVGGVPGETLMAGYLGDTAPIEEGWLHTGDVVRVDEDGFFHFVDRRKDMLKRAGENISAGEVEAVLAAHPRVRDVAVRGLPDPVYDEQVAAFVVAPGAEPDELRTWCAERLVAFKVPTYIELRDELPRTAVGKIQKHLLRPTPQEER